MESVSVLSEASESKQSEIEKLMQLLYLSSDQMDTVDDQQLIGCVAQLSALSLQELAEAPSRIQAEEESLRHKTEKLAVENYPIFLANASTSREVHREFESISTSNDLLLNLVFQASSTAQAISRKTDNYGLNFRRNARLAQNHTQLLEFLELPQLMETCVQNGYYEDALNILAHAKRMCKKHGQSVPVVRIVAAQTEQISGQLFFQLCKQLREPITLPVCLKIVVYLRQLGAFSEQELRLNFLQARGACLLQQLSAALSRPVAGLTVDPLGSSYPGLNASFSGARRMEQESYILAMRRIEVTRVHLFDIITQYRAVFADEDGFPRGSGLSASKPDGSTGGELSSHTLLANISPLNLEYLPGFTLPPGSVVDGLACPKPSSTFHAWLVTQISAFLDGLASDLEGVLRLPKLSVAEVTDQLAFLMTNKDSAPSSGTADDALSYAATPEAVTSAFQRVHSLLTQSLYFGRSFARIGCDFRAHLAILFSREILSYFEALLSNALTEFYATLEQWPWELEGCEDSEAQNDSTADASSSIQPPITLLRYPPLAVFCNRLLTALNGLKTCCPIGLKQGVMIALLRNLRLASEAVVSTYHARTDQHLVGIFRAKAANLAAACVHSAVPHLLTCALQHLFGGEMEGHLWQLHLPSSTGLPTTHSLIEALGREVCRPLTDTWHKLSQEGAASSSAALTDSGEPRRDDLNEELPSSPVLQQCLNAAAAPSSVTLESNKTLKAEEKPAAPLPFEETQPDTEVAGGVSAGVVDFVDKKSNEHILSKSPLTDQSSVAGKPAVAPRLQTPSPSSTMCNEPIGTPMSGTSGTLPSVTGQFFPPGEDYEKPVQLTGCSSEERVGNVETVGVSLHGSPSVLPSTVPLSDRTPVSASSASPAPKSDVPLVVVAGSNNNADVLLGDTSVSGYSVQAQSPGLNSLSSEAAVVGLKIPSQPSPAESPSGLPATMEGFTGVPSEQGPLGQTKEETARSASPPVVWASEVLGVCVPGADGDSSTVSSCFHRNPVGPRSPVVGTPETSNEAREFGAVEGAPTMPPSSDTGFLAPASLSVSGNTALPEEPQKLPKPETPTQSPSYDYQIERVQSEGLATAPSVDADNSLLKKHMDTLLEAQTCLPDVGEPSADDMNPHSSTSDDVSHRTHEVIGERENKMVDRVDVAATVLSTVADVGEVTTHHGTDQSSEYTPITQPAEGNTPLMSHLPPLTVNTEVSGNDLDTPGAGDSLSKGLETYSVQRMVKPPGADEALFRSEDSNNPPSAVKPPGNDEDLQENRDRTSEAGEEVCASHKAPSPHSPEKPLGASEVKSELDDWDSSPTSATGPSSTQASGKSLDVPASTKNDCPPPLPCEAKAEANQFFPPSELSPETMAMPPPRTIDSCHTPHRPRPEPSVRGAEVSPSFTTPSINSSHPENIQHDPAADDLSHTPHSPPEEKPLMDPVITTANVMDPAVSNVHSFVESSFLENPLQTVQRASIPPPKQESSTVVKHASPSSSAVEAASTGGMLSKEDNWESWDESPPDEEALSLKEEKPDAVHVNEQKSVGHIVQPVGKFEPEHIPEKRPTDDAVSRPVPPSEAEPSDEVENSGWVIDF